MIGQIDALKEHGSHRSHVVESLVPVNGILRECLVGVTLIEEVWGCLVSVTLIEEVCHW